MATTKVLKMVFSTMSGKKTWSIANATNPDFAANQIKSAAATIIANGSIYEYPPLELDSAELVETITTKYDLS